MPRESAPTKATGGGGFTFADKVAAGFLAQMLKRTFPLEPELGPIVEVHFETRDCGQVLDDLLLLLNRGSDTTRCAISVKSNRQLTKGGFNAEFVQDAWEQWRGAARSHFNPETDLLGLIVGVIDNQTLQEWRGLQKQTATTTPERMVQRLADTKQSSATQRAIFESLRSLPNGVPPDSLETARLASRIRVVPFSDDKEGDYVNLCTAIVVAGSLDEGTKLWSRLLQLAAESRATGGYFDIPKLIRTLRPDFELRDHPDFEADWSRIESVTAENLRAVRAVIANDIQLARDDERARLASEIQGHKVTAIAGESGSGKSALLTHLVAPGGAFKRTLWLTAGQLSRPSQAEIAHAFNLRHNITQLIANSGLHGCALVLDGLEHFEGDARRRAVELIKAVKEVGLAGWHLVITCQPQSWESVQDTVIEAGISDAHKVDFEKPELQQVFRAVEHVPGIGVLLLRSELQPILRNLFVLDWVLRAEVAQRLSTSSRPWIGETELINCIWDRWMGESTMRIARDSLLRTLGQQEGERLSGTVHVDAIPQDQLPLLGTLSRDGLVRVNLPFVQFTHDLMGDWARFRILVFAGNDAIQKIKAVANIPRWGRAIRLYAQSLAEQGDGLAKWKSVTARLTGDDAETQLTNDLFLDGLLFAANSESLLEQVWPDLIADGGQILHRFLKRLLHVASFPDWRLRGLVDPKVAEQSEAWFRIPLPLYWYPALRVLSRHSQEIAQNSLLQAAEACALWLRTIPVGWPGRREASLLALELAKETQGRVAEGMHFGEKNQIIYEAMLSAAPEFPEEVSQIALELSARRDEPRHATQRAIEAQERQAKLREEWLKNHPDENRTRRNIPPTMLSYPKGPMRAPAADGPLREVSDGFRSAVLETPALNGLIGVRPGVAREVLLAVCIDEPKPSDPDNDRMFPLQSYGLADWWHGSPPLPLKGPFLKFLQDAPESGLDAIVCLVNYATTRWLEAGLGPNPSEEQRRKYGLEFEFGGKLACWPGDANVYGWHRYFPRHGNTVECALMALEKWLYDEVQKGRSIAPRVQYLFEHAESLAFAGVLVSVGLKYPMLFAGELQPLLGNLHIYQCQLSWSLNEQQEVWTIALAGQPQTVVKLGAEWHRMPHRRIALQDLAPRLMLQHEGTRRYLATRKDEWSKRLENHDEDRDALEFFLARFDPKNYTETPQPDGSVLITHRWPAHLEAKSKQALEENNVRMLSLGLAIRARQLLDGQKKLQPQELPEFAADIQRLANLQSREDQAQEQYRINSIAGGIAVLIVQHRSWLSQNPELENWCMDTLRDLKPAEDFEHDTPVSALDHTSESFLGEAGVALLQESSEEWVLRMAFEGVTGFYYGSTLQTMWRAYLLRERLGEEFGELVNVVILWSALRRAADRESGYQADRALLAKYKETLFRRFSAGNLKGPLIPLRKTETMGRRLVERVSRRSMSLGEKLMREARRNRKYEQGHDRKLRREMPDIDLEVIRKGFAFLPGMVRAPLPSEGPRLEQYVRELFDLEMRTLPRPETGGDWCEVEGTPYEFDVWVMARIVEFIAHANSVEIAHTFYRPILELGPAARYWVEDFLQAWVSIGLEMTTDTATFGKIWVDMVHRAMTLPAWQPRKPGYWCPVETLAVDLMGLHEAAASVLGQAKYKTLVSAMTPVFEEWASRWLKYASAAAWFARFLPTESGHVLLSAGIKQLAGVVGSFEDRDWHHHGLGALFSEAISECWKHLRNEVESQPELRKAFLSILTELCARQIPEALHLRNKVTAALSAS